MCEVLLLAQVVIEPAANAAKGDLIFALWCGLVATGAAAAAALTWWLAQKAVQSKRWAAVAALSETVQSLVAHVEVHLRPSVRAALADGNLSKDEAVALKAKALQLLKDAALPATLDAARKALLLTAPGLEVYLSGLIERALSTQRAAVLPPAAPGSAPASTVTGAAPLFPLPR